MKRPYRSIWISRGITAAAAINLSVFCIATAPHRGNILYLAPDSLFCSMKP